MLQGPSFLACLIVLVIEVSEPSHPVIHRFAGNA
jgi:hypothetical protein